MREAFQHSITNRADPSLALAVTFRAKARQQYQIDETAGEKQAPEKSPGQGVSILPVRHYAQDEYRRAVSNDNKHVLETLQMHRLMGS